MNAVTDAVERARRLLAETALFRELGLDELTANARALATVTIDLAEQLEAERSGRRAMQQRAERLERLLLNRGVQLEPHLDEPAGPQ